MSWIRTPPLEYYQQALFLFSFSMFSSFLNLLTATLSKQSPDLLSNLLTSSPFALQSTPLSSTLSKWSPNVTSSMPSIETFVLLLVSFFLNCSIVYRKTIFFVLHSIFIFIVFLSLCSSSLFSFQVWVFLPTLWWCGRRPSASPRWRRRRATHACPAWVSECQRNLSFFSTCCWATTTASPTSLWFCILSLSCASYLWTVELQIVSEK